MHTRDYAALADALNCEYQAGGHPQTLSNLAISIAGVCAADNPRFDTEAFFDACSMGGLEIEGHDSKQTPMLPTPALVIETLSGRILWP